MDATHSELDRRILRMFALVGEGIRAATEAFLAGDQELARQVASADQLLDDLQREIEAEVEARLLETGPRSTAEVRNLIAALRIAPEIERTGDLVELVALRTPQRLAREIPPGCRAMIGEMGDVAAEMWSIAADAYGDTDTGAAARLRTRDDALDDLHVSLTSELADGDLSVPVAIEMGLVARFYERLGDHAVNIARRLSSADAPDAAAVRS